MKAREALIQWIKPRVDQWVEFRRTRFDEAWNRYEKAWRGIWDGPNYESERSKIVHPITTQAVDMITSELEEALFGREYWVDVEDDLLDPQRLDIALLRDVLIEDMEVAGVRQGFISALLYGVLFGTGIVKVIVEPHKRVAPATLSGLVGALETEDVRVVVEPIDPRFFAIDPAVNISGRAGIMMSIGCAHVIHSPRWKVEQRQADGQLWPGPLSGPTAQKLDPQLDVVELVEYWGLVPAKFLGAAEKDGEAPKEPGDLVEARLLWSGTTLLAASPNPSVWQDRPVFAFAFDPVPGQFWGTGVCAKLDHIQRTLNAFLRAQLDGVAMSVHPMVAVDATKLTEPFFDPTVMPGKTIMTVGNPNEVVSFMRLPSVDTLSWNITSDLERMATLASGAADTALPLRTNRRNETASGMSIMVGQMLRRTRRVLRRIEADLVNPAVEAILRRYMQFAPERYPSFDGRFIVRSTLGTVAREYEIQQLVTLVQSLAAHPAFAHTVAAVMRSIVDMSNVPFKGQILAALEQPVQVRDSESETLSKARELAELREIVSRTELKQAKTAETLSKIREQRD